MKPSFGNLLQINDYSYQLFKDSKYESALFKFDVPENAHKYYDSETGTQHPSITEIIFDSDDEKNIAIEVDKKFKTQICELRRVFQEYKNFILNRNSPFGY